MFHFDGNQIVSKSVGVDFEEFRNLFSEDERAFGFVRIQVFTTSLIRFGINASTMFHSRVMFRKRLDGLDNGPSAR